MKFRPQELPHFAISAFANDLELDGRGLGPCLCQTALCCKVNDNIGHIDLPMYKNASFNSIAMIERERTLLRCSFFVPTSITSGK